MQSTVSIEREMAALPKIVVTQDVSLAQSGDYTKLLDAREFYETWFPFSGVWDGTFVLDRKDERVQRYLEATERKDHDDRRCMLTLLATEAEKSFSTRELLIRFKANRRQP